MADCATCVSALPAGARFCPECGRPTDPAQVPTAVAAVPAEETGPVPVHHTSVSRVPDGLERSTAALGRAGGRLRERVGAAWESYVVRTGGRRRAAELRYELLELGNERTRLLTALGEAVYGSDEELAASLRAQVAEVDERIASKEGEMSSIAASVEERVEAVRRTVQPTVVAEIQPPAVPEPGPAVVPEPGPVPSPAPGPAVVPEPGPEPHRQPQPDPGPPKTD